MLLTWFPPVYGRISRVSYAISRRQSTSGTGGFGPSNLFPFDRNSGRSGRSPSGCDTHFRLVVSGSQRRWTSYAQRLDASMLVFAPKLCSAASASRASAYVAVSPVCRRSPLLTGAYSLTSEHRRFIYYSTNYELMHALLGFLTENCCSGQRYAPAVVARRKRRA